MSETYRSSHCDLCGSASVAEVLSPGTQQSMTSDYRTMPAPLAKLVCGHCGLLRSAAVPFDELARRYKEEYFIGSENYFYSCGVAIPRARVFADWMVEAFGADIWRGPLHVLEVGASDGLLLAELRNRFPGNSYEALELSETGARACRELGFDTHSCMLSELEAAQYDLIYCIAVLEHTFSPTEFLASVSAKLRTGGLFLLCQPTQDVYSHDIFFIDHLYHFGGKHIAEYAAKGGFAELGSEVGHALVPSFSMHLWRREERERPYRWSGAAAATSAPDSFHRIMADIERLNALLEEFRSEGRSIAAFGVHELFLLLRIYSDLGRFPIACGLDDKPSKSSYGQFDFPVVVPERCAELGVADVFLTMNRAYYPQVIPRLQQLGLNPHEVFS